MTRKWLTLKDVSGTVIGYVKMGLKISDISVAMRAANDEVKQTQVVKVTKPVAKAVAKKPVAKPIVKKIVAKKVVAKKVVAKKTAKAAGK